MKEDGTKRSFSSFPFCSEALWYGPGRCWNVADVGWVVTRTKARREGLAFINTGPNKQHVHILRVSTYSYTPTTHTGTRTHAYDTYTWGEQAVEESPTGSHG